MLEVRKEIVKYETLWSLCYSV